MTTEFAPLSYSQLAVASADELVFGVAQRPVRCGFGLEIGAGKVYPEVNFTLPTMEHIDETWREVCAHYEEIASQVARPRRAPQVARSRARIRTPAGHDRATGVGRGDHAHPQKRIWRRRIKRTGTAMRPSRHADRHSREGQASADAARRSLRGALSLVRTQRRGRRRYFVDRVGRRQGSARQGAGAGRHPGHRLCARRSRPARHDVALGANPKDLPAPSRRRFREATRRAVSPTPLCNWPARKCCRKCSRRSCAR